jgi:hypothetical protein
MADSLSDLELKVTSYKHQLQQIILILISDPRNESFLKLKDDLEKLIALTENLISVRRSELIADKLSNDVVSAAAYKDASIASAKNSSVQAESFSSVSQPNDNLQKTNANHPSNCPFFVGDIVEAISGERPFPAVVIGILPDSQECTVKYFEFESPVNVLYTDLKKITPGSLSSQEVSIGLKCQGKIPHFMLYFT